MLGRYNLAIFYSYKRHKQKLLLLSQLNDFTTCSVHFNIQSEGLISQLWDTVDLRG